MTEHVHEWKPSPDKWGAYYCASGTCPDGMPEIDSTEVLRRLNATERLKVDYEKLLLITGVFLDKILVYADHKRGCTWDDGTKGDVCTCGLRPLVSGLYNGKDAYANILEGK